MYKNTNTEDKEGNPFYSILACICLFSLKHFTFTYFLFLITCYSQFIPNLSSQRQSLMIYQLMQRDFWPWIWFSAFNIKSLAAENKILINNSKNQIRLNLKEICEEANSTCIAAVHNVLQPHKNNKAKLYWSTYKTILRPCLQITVLGITIIIIYYITHRSSCSIRSCSKFSNLTVLKCKFKFTLSYSFLSTKWIPVFHSKGKNPCKTDCNYVGDEGEHPRAVLWKTVVHFNISASLQQPINNGWV